MPELRQDPTTDNWVILAPERAKRDHQFPTKKPRVPAPAYRRDCPFCPGHESQTPPEVLAYREGGGPNGSGWRLRVVPNRYAALTAAGGTQSHERDAFYARADSVGLHEVIIESPVHNLGLGRLQIEQVTDVVRAYRERYLAAKQDPRVRFITIFKNHGMGAGTSLAHPHSQLVALPLVPPAVEQKLKSAKRYREGTGRCLYVDLWAHERVAERIVFETDRFVVFAPFASRVPYEMWIMPKRPVASFAQMTDEEIPELAHALRQALSKLDRALHDPDFNFVIHTVPVADEHNPSFCWHMQILPRLTQLAGFELGLGIHVNTTPPERAAALLRASGA